MRLSVIVPVYNGASGGTLVHCLDSLLSQTIPKSDYEVIAIDDASTDDTLSLLRDYEKREGGNLRVLHSEVNLRQGGAKNMGLGIARGEWISFIDADDWVRTDFYEKLLTLADERGADVCGCDLTRVTEYTTRVAERIPNHTKEQEGVLDDEKKRSLVLDAGALVVNIYKRHVVYGEEEGKEHPEVFPEHMFYEDNAAGSSFMMRATCFAYLPEAMYFYYQHEDSTTHTVTYERLRDRLRAARILLERSKENGALARFREEIEYKYTRLFYINTLFSAMQQKKLPGVYAFTRGVAREMKETFPDFEKNPYYEREVHPEEKKLIAMQMRSHFLFYVYYRALHAYRSVRYGK
ncbi:MAG: glycosyltransferase family 2 protein [Lachnospiraceae bacterium]|nr:glycosyltransferase family 2 protein [Lachnospiraceae bacterium]